MGETTRDSTTSLDPLDSFPPLRVHQSDGDDAASPSSRYSSCGESEFDRYCSANSAMGTPSVRSTVSLYNDFSELDFGSVRGFEIGEDSNRLENFSLGGGGRAEVNQIDHDKFGTGPRSLGYGSSGLEFYGDDGGDELATVEFNHMVEPFEERGGGNELKGVDGYVGIKSSCNSESGNVRNGERIGLRDVDGFASEVMVEEGGGIVRLDGYDVRSSLEGGEREMEREGVGGLSDCEEHTVGEASMYNYGAGGESGLSCGAVGIDGFDVRSNFNCGESETETDREENGGLSDFEHSEGENSMYSYGSDGENKNESYLSRVIHYRKEPELQNENPLLINSSVAFGSDDLDDFLMENVSCDPLSMSNPFHIRRERNHEVGEDPAKLGSLSSAGCISASQKESGKDKKDMVIINEKLEELKGIGEPVAIEEVRDTPTFAVNDFLNTVNPQDQGSDNLVKTSTTTEACEVNLDPLTEEAQQCMSMNVKGDQSISIENVIATSDAQHVKKSELDHSKIKFDQFSDSRVDQIFYNSSNHIGNINVKSFKRSEQNVPPSNHGMKKTLESYPMSTNLLETSPVISKIEDFEPNEFYDEVVQEMEDILLDSMDSPRAKFAMGNRLLKSQVSMPLRDGGLTASTSSTNDTYLLVQRPTRIDRIEVVGARQKKGDVSFSERLVGVKEYTVYKIKVWSGKDQWEVEKRYRDFLALCRCMKTLFTDQGWNLPLPWSSVDKESNIFRSSSPDIIVKRSVLIQECLQSILRTRFFSTPPSALVWFLSPQDLQPVSPVSNTPVSPSSFNRNFSTLGKTISLIVEIPPNKSVKQLLDAQHYTCAGCHMHFDDGKTLIWDFVQTLGWGKPRLCEYTGQLFCSSCHTNETAVLPARVLHHWDFTHYPVSQMAKSYLDSILEQPMLCVTAVNPFLLSKVPALLHVMNMRKKIGSMLPYVHCPFRRSINRGLGNRRYLLEINDFFALRDLIDLSKGVFAALPTMVETVSRKILEHITDQCLVCCDVGIPCSARQDCNDPVSLIFPFQEDDIERCKACQSVFHKRCFRKLPNCPCRVHLRLNETRSLTDSVNQRGDGETRGPLDMLGSGFSSGLSSRFLSRLFTREKPENTRVHKDGNIILMGSLPSTSL
ncbi:PREDICTED: uncharacterized protein LOC109343381 isoform X1 [Lupinus angustifolius]|uniref:uncharacterized protein LOC109343381 isoform X1 n=1 Tax=Lupinus angustifolius TaxID=3871 RepID=UPI00092F3CE3|nr:PREDICTED: uncharacterized protein LOC109343381 isoform X1 [Lupinus angustifolius]XP_019437168.1 PREDICTED: uncharacterized protein LOC109343381 isoform X1 [Lupinus angustifolius]